MNKKEIFVASIITLLIIVGPMLYIFGPNTEELMDVEYEYRILVYDFSTDYSDVKEDVENAFVRVSNIEAETSSSVIEIFNLKNYQYNEKNSLMGEGIVKLQESRMHEWMIQVNMNTSEDRRFSYTIYLKDYTNKSAWQRMNCDTWIYSFTSHKGMSPYVIEIQFMEVI
jgi:hypothetical protein